MTDRIWIAVAAFVLAALPLSAQNGAYNGFSPYSVYGIGDLHAAGTAFNASMGGVGIATRAFLPIPYMASATSMPPEPPSTPRWAAWASPRATSGS